MVNLILTLTLFFAAPFILVGVAMKSWVLALVGLVFGALYLVFFFMNGFSEFLIDLKAVHVSDELDSRLQRLWKLAGPERVSARFWTYPSPLVEFKFWVAADKKLEIIFSQGLIQMATDSGLKAAFQSVSEMKIAETKLQNRLHALTIRIERIKGPKEDFRYWLLSFWLYPLERLLNIARI